MAAKPAAGCGVLLGLNVGKSVLYNNGTEEMERWEGVAA